MFMALSRGIDKLNDAIAGIVSWALLLAVIICAVNALVRYTFKMSSNAWLEIQWYLFAAVFMLASAHTLRRDEHVRIDVITGHFSKRTQVWIDLAGYHPVPAARLPADFLFRHPLLPLFLPHGRKLQQRGRPDRLARQAAGAGRLLAPAAAGRLRNHQAHRLPGGTHRRP